MRWYEDADVIVRIVNEKMKHNADMYHNFTPTYITNKFERAFTFYYGMGHHAYLLSNVATEEQMVEIIGNRRRTGDEMIADLKELDPNANLAVLDVEMGGVQVW